MKLTDFAIRRPVTIVMAVCIILLVGFISLTDLNIDLFPEMDLPIAAVITNYDGTGPEEIETLVTRPLEDSLGMVSNVESVQSVSRMGSSTVMVQFGWGTDMDFAALDMREQVDMVKGMLPDDADDPLIVRMDPAMMPIKTLAVSGDMHPAALRELADDEISMSLERIEGVASVDIVGGLEREISVSVDPEILRVHGISLQQVTQKLRAENINVSSGHVISGDKEYLVRILGQYDSVDEIKNINIESARGVDIRLGALADVEDGYKDTRGYSLIDGRESVALFIQKESDANTVEVARSVDNTIDELLEGRLPDTVDIVSIIDQSEFIEFSINNLIQNLIIGGILAIFVLLVFLRNIRSTLIIAAAIPVSLVTTFSLLYFQGLTLNMMTLGGLALGVGMMVDNAIVILENIFRHRQRGLRPDDAASLGSSEVAMAIVISTLTTVAVFFPVVFIEGIASEIFGPLAVTVSFALLASLLVALTLIPMMTSQILPVVPDYDYIRPTNIKERILYASGIWLKLLREKYQNLLKWALKFKKTVIFIAAGTLVISLIFIPRIGAEFIPEADAGTLTVDIEMPLGTKLEKTEEAVAKVTAIIEEQEEVKNVFATVGASGATMGFQGGQPDQASIDAVLVDIRERERDVQEVVEDVRREVQRIPGAEFSVTATDPLMFGGGDFGEPVQLEIRGDDLDVLEEISNDIAGIVAFVPGTREVATSAEEGRPEAQFIIDRAKAAAYGLDVSRIADLTGTAVDGQIATQYRTGIDEVDVRVIFPEEQRETLQALEDLSLLTPAGVHVPLSEVGEVRITEGPTLIERQDRTRYVTVTADIHDRDLSSVIQDIEGELENYTLPAGYTVATAGEAEEMAEAFGDLTLALIIAIILVYMILAAKFESFTHPLAIMLSMPLTIIGVVAALVIAGWSFSVPVFIGVIMLAGIVVNNAIVFVDYINILRERGIERTEAILQAGEHRFRPIIMTAATTILAMIPIALIGGEGHEFRAPMAVAVIGGLLTSTLLTLVVIPVAYIYFDNLGNLLKKGLGKIKDS